jgi:hypothetical protein
MTPKLGPSEATELGPSEATDRPEGAAAARPRSSGGAAPPCYRIRTTAGPRNRFCYPTPTRVDLPGHPWSRRSPNTSIERDVRPPAADPSS